MNVPMDTPWEMRRCDADTDRTRKRRRLSYLGPDRLTGLPDQILGHILSRLPTKDVSVTQVLSKSMIGTLSLLTSVDFDDNRICPCKPGVVDRFLQFKSFVDKVLQTLLHSEVSGLTRFRLCFGGDQSNPPSPWFEHIDECFPYLEPARLSAWISYPLTHTTLKEIDLSFRICNYKEFNILPPHLFNSQSLEVFRLDCFFRIDGAHVPLMYLPNLKLLHIFAGVFSEDDIVTRLISSCPVLEDLTISDVFLEKFDSITISSHCLRRLVLTLGQEGRPNSVTIDTPNLQYFKFGGELARHYSITHMNALVEAELNIGYDDVERNIQSSEGLLNALSAVQHLSLQQYIFESVSPPADIEDHLSMFRNLRTISLPPDHQPELRRGDVILASILQSSPLLETLVFPRGAYAIFDPHCCDREAAYSDAEGWGSNILPSLCLTHLKRIEFGRCRGSDREFDMIKYFLRKALALKELVLCLLKKETPPPFRFAQGSLEEYASKLEELPRASNSCSIKVRRDLL